jgi:acyltransferase-like protein
MLLVFTVHAAEPFNPWDAWHIESPFQSKAFGELALFLAPWVMPLFMVLAGESAWFALARRSSGEYVRERLLRIGLPLVAGILLLVPPQVWLERRLRGEFEGSLLAFYPRFFDGIYPRGNFSWHHLWFLVFLLAFALVTLPLFQWLRSPDGRRVLARLARPCEGAAGLAWLVLPAVGIRLAIELLLPGVTLLSYDWSNRGLLLLAFVAGFALEAEPGFRRAVDRHWRTALGAALAISAALLAWAWPGHVLARLPAPRSAAGALLWAGYACGTACWLVALLGGARRHLERRAKGLARASALVYPFYVLHHPIVVAVAFAVVRWRLALPAAFVVLWVVSLAATVAFCRIVESSSVLRVLFGLRRRA